MSSIVLIVLEKILTKTDPYALSSPESIEKGTAMKKQNCEGIIY
jgi:hypothetical protein